MFDLDHKDHLVDNVFKTSKKLKAKHIMLLYPSWGLLVNQRRLHLSIGFLHISIQLSQASILSHTFACCCYKSITKQLHNQISFLSAKAQVTRERTKKDLQGKNKNKNKEKRTVMWLLDVWEWPNSLYALVTVGWLHLMEEFRADHTLKSARIKKARELYTITYWKEKLKVRK